MRKIVNFTYKKSLTKSLGFYFVFNSDLSPEAIVFLGSKSFGLRLFGKEEVPKPVEKKKRVARKPSVKKVEVEETPKVESVEVKKRTTTRKRKPTSEETK